MKTKSRRYTKRECYFCENTYSRRNYAEIWNYNHTVKTIVKTCLNCAGISSLVQRLTYSRRRVA